MGWRLVAAAFGCAGVLTASAGIASHYIGQGAGHQAPQFLMTALQADPGPSWPPSDASVAFNDEMFALLTMGASVRVATREAAPEVMPGRMSRQDRRRAQREERMQAREDRAQAWEQDTREREDVEIHVRDRYGNTLRVQRVDRELGDERPQVYARRSFRRFRPFGRW